MKKNIAIVVTRLDLGGAQKVAFYLAENLDSRKFNVHLIAGKGGYLDKEITSPKSQIPKTTIVNLWDELVHPINPFFDVLAFFRLISYFKKNNIEIVHTHSSKAGFLGRLAAKAAGVPKIIHTVHGFPFHENQNFLMWLMYLLLERFCAQYTDKFVAVGKDVMEYGLKNGIGTREKYAVIRAGVDIKQFGMRNAEFGIKGKGRKAFLQKYGLDPQIYTVGMIGNLKKQKNPAGFIRIAASCLKKDRDIQFVFAGGGKNRDDFDSRLKDLGISDRVKFTGWCEEPGKFMKSIDLFLLASLWEGLACTLPQALAAGKPILASDIGGNREFVEYAKAGELYPAFDYKQAAEKIIVFKVNRVKYSPKKSVLKEFDLKYMLKLHEKLYLSF